MKPTVYPRLRVYFTVSCFRWENLEKRLRLASQYAEVEMNLSIEKHFLEKIIFVDVKGSWRDLNDFRRHFYGSTETHQENVSLR